MGDDSLRGRFTRQGEETIGRLAQELLEHPVVTGALSAAFGTRERAVRAQEAAMGALNLPSAADIERLTRRVRSVSQRLEAIEDHLDRLQERLGSGDGGGELEARLAGIEAALARLEGARRPAAPARTRAPAKPRAVGGNGPAKPRAVGGNAPAKPRAVGGRAQAGNAASASSPRRRSAS